MTCQNTISCFLFSLLLFIFGCSSDTEIDIPDHIASLENLTVIPENAEPLHAIELERTAVYGDTDEVIIGQLGVVTVDEQGRVYLADRSQNVIHIYEPDGSYLTKIGREGDGPGEFRQIRSMQVEEDKLHVMDMTTMRISTFNLNSQNFINDLEIPFEFDHSGWYSNFPLSFYLKNENNFIVHYGVSYSAGSTLQDEAAMEHSKVLNRNDGSFAEEKLYEFRTTETLTKTENNSIYLMAMDYKRGTKYSINGEHMMWGWSEDLLFKIHDMDGNYVRAIYQPLENRPLNRNEVINKYADRTEPWRSMVRNDAMPETWPAFSTMLTDDENRIWAALFDDDDEIWNWRIFTQHGELFASFNRPRNKQIQEIRNGYVYTRETDEETGLVQVVKYGIQFN